MMPSPPTKIQVLPPGNWEYQVAPGPIWSYVEVAMSGGASDFTSPADHIGFAADAFKHVFLPPRRMRRAVMIDNAGIVLFGYAWEHNEPTPRWYGCEAGFVAMELSGVDPLELALWESMARDYSDSADWWKK